MDESREQTERYCPLLGHHIPLRYCLAPGTVLPCLKLRSCWGSRKGIDVEELLREKLTEEQRQEYESSDSLPKITSILSIAEEYRKGP